MRNPAKRRSASLVIAIIGAATLIGTMLQNRGRSPVEGSWFAIVIASFFVTLFAIVGVITYQVHLRWMGRLKRGHRRLAQWTVSAAEWDQFRTNDKTWLDTGRGNSLNARKQASGVPVEVIIAQDALMVGDDFYHLGALRDLQWIPETPPSLEYNMVTSGKNGAVKWNIRLPVATGADAGARAVWDYVHRPRPFDYARSLRRLRLSRMGGLIVAAVSGLTFLMTRTYYVMRTSGNGLWVFIASLVALPVGLFVFGLCHMQLRTLARELRNKA